MTRGGRIVVGWGNAQLAQQRDRLVAQRLPRAKILGDGVDPAGFVVQLDGQVLRFVDDRMAPAMTDLITQSSIVEAVECGLLTRIARGGPVDLPGYTTFTHPDRMPPIERMEVDLQACAERLLRLDHLLRDAQCCLGDVGMQQWLAGPAGPTWCDWGSIMPARFVPRSRFRFMVNHIYGEPADGGEPISQAVERDLNPPIPPGHRFEGLEIGARANAWLRGLVRRAPQPIADTARRLAYRKGIVALHVPSGATSGEAREDVAEVPS